MTWKSCDWCSVESSMNILTNSEVPGDFFLNIQAKRFDYVSTGWRGKDWVDTGWVDLVLLKTENLTVYYLATV